MASRRLARWANTITTAIVVVIAAEIGVDVAPAAGPAAVVTRAAADAAEIVDAAGVVVAIAAAAVDVAKIVPYASRARAIINPRALNFCKSGVSL